MKLAYGLNPHQMQGSAINSVKYDQQNNIHIQYINIYSLFWKTDKILLKRKKITFYFNITDLML